MSALPHVLNHEELAAFLAQAGATSDFAEDVLEKDLWVVWCLQALFSDPTLAAQLSFKGGTSLSKAYGAITRFSEDVDLTIDYRVFDDPFDPFAETSTTPSRNKIKAFRERVEGDHVPHFNRNSILPRLQAFAQETLDERRQPVIELGEGADKVIVTYPNVSAAHGYLKEGVLLEFGGRMGIEPCEPIAVTTYLEDELPALQGAVTFPIATPQVLHGARTFWEKVTAVHAFITRNNAAEHFRGGRHEARSESRHWYDVNALYQHPRLGREVLARTDLRDLVIRVKQQQFAIGGVDYEACGRGGVRLVPQGDLRAAVLADYEIMQERGMFRESDPPPNFDDLMTKMQELEDVLNTLPHT